jgi:hypothetical protein
MGYAYSTSTTRITPESPYGFTLSKRLCMYYRTGEEGFLMMHQIHSCLCATQWSRRTVFNKLENQGKRRNSIILRPLNAIREWIFVASYCVSPAYCGRTILRALLCTSGAHRPRRKTLSPIQLFGISLLDSLLLVNCIPPTSMRTIMAKQSH